MLLLIHGPDLAWRESPVPDEQAFAAMKTALNSASNSWNAGQLYGKTHANFLHQDVEKIVISGKERARAC